MVARAAGRSDEFNAISQIESVQFYFSSTSSWRARRASLGRRHAEVSRVSGVLRARILGRHPAALVLSVPKS
jgi:hypothetical protein